MKTIIVPVYYVIIAVFDLNEAKTGEFSNFMYLPHLT